jgi:hypothetical protein
MTSQSARELLKSIWTVESGLVSICYPDAFHDDRTVCFHGNTIHRSHLIPKLSFLVEAHSCNHLQYKSVTNHYYSFIYSLSEGSELSEVK